MCGYCDEMVERSVFIGVIVDGGERRVWFVDGDFIGNKRIVASGY